MPEPRRSASRLAPGRTVWVQLGAALLRDEEGAPSGIVLQLIDVTETRDAREALREMAEHDPLTGVFNRAPLEEGSAGWSPPGSVGDCARRCCTSTSTACAR